MAMMLPPVRKRHSGWRLFLMTVIGRSYPRVVGMQREVSWIFFDTFLPMLGVVAYVFVYRAIKAPEDYVGFVVMGGLFATTLRALGIILLGSLLFQVHYVIASAGQLILVFFLTMVALYGLGMMTASLYLLLSREAYHLSNLAQEPVFLISGFYFPIKSFPAWVPVIGSIIPLTMGMDAMRQLAFASGPSLGWISVKMELIGLVVSSVVFLFGARLLLDYMERLAVREGRLTESRG